jgi:hypothetical protein
MNQLTDKLIEFSGILLQDLYLANQQIDSSFDQSCEIPRIDNMINNINKVINYYNLLNSKLDMIKSKTLDVKHKCFNAYDKFVNKIYIFYEDKLNLFRSWIETAKSFDYYGLFKIVKNEGCLQFDKFMEKVHKGWEINKCIYNKITEKINNTFGTYFQNVITVTQIGKEKIRLSLQKINSPLEMFSLFSFIESQLTKIKLSDDLLIFESFRKFLM